MSMKISIVETDGTVQNTGAIMHWCARTYAVDMAPWASLSVLEVYDRIKALPFRADPIDMETVQRPFYTMNSTGYGGDCDDKCVCMAAYCILHGIPYRFVALRRPDRKDLHHVALELYINHRWVFVDPTYAFNSFGREPSYAERVYI